MISRPALGSAFVLLLVLAGCAGVDSMAPDSASLLLVAQPSSVGVGGEKARLTLSAFEGSGFPVHDGTVMVFTATLGRVVPERVETRGGFAFADFISGDQVGTAVITVTSGNAAPASVEIQVGGAAAAVAVTANPSVLPLGGGRSNITATVLDTGGRGIPGTAVVFGTSAGILDSAGGTVITDGSGRARDVLDTTVDATVTAALGDGSSRGSAFVDVEGGGSQRISLTASPDVLTAAGGSVELTASVTDELGAPLAGVAVAFSSSAGTLARAGSVVTNSLGVAANTLTTDTTASVVASTGQVSASVTVTVVSGGAWTVELAVSPGVTVTDTTPPAGNECTAANPNSDLPLELTATVYDGTGLPVEGAIVSFSVTTADQAGTQAGRFCKIPSSETTGPDGTATILYDLDDADNLACSTVPACGCCSLEFTASTGNAISQREVEIFCPENPTLTFEVLPVVNVTDTSAHTTCAVPSGNSHLPLELKATLADSLGTEIDNARVTFWADPRTSDSVENGNFCGNIASGDTGAGGVPGVISVTYDWSDTELATCAGITPVLDCPDTLTCCCALTFYARAECVGTATRSQQVLIMSTGCSY
jgi:protocatechuate 3,4-dioxygenase beta subunit